MAVLIHPIVAEDEEGALLPVGQVLLGRFYPLYRCELCGFLCASAQGHECKVAE